MWMFLLGLIIGILIMVLWFSYSQKRVESSQLEQPKKDFSSPMLTQHADSNSASDYRYDKHQPQTASNSDWDNSDNRSDMAPKSSETAESAATTLHETPESAADAATDTTAYAAPSSKATDNLTDRDAGDNTDDDSANDDDSSTNTNNADNSADTKADDQQNDIEPNDTASKTADDEDDYGASTNSGSILASDDEADMEAVPSATVNNAEDDHTDIDAEESVVDDQPSTTADGDKNSDSNNNEAQSVDIKALMAGLPKAETDADDLKKIKGIGPKLESMLNDLGISTFKQVASLDDRQCKEVSLAIKTFPDRIYRDQWVKQAKQFHDEKYS